MANDLYINIIATDSASAAFRDASSSASQMAGNMETAGDQAQNAGQDLEQAGQSAESASTDFNNASAQMRSAGESCSSAGTEAENAGTKMETAGSKAEGASTKFTASAANIATGFSGLTLAGYSLYDSFDSVEKKQLSLDRANNTLAKSEANVEEKQVALNKAINTYGVNSEEAALAADELTQAQNDCSLAAETAKQKQNDVNDAQTKAYLMVLPSLITGIKSVKDLYDGLTTAGPKIVEVFGNIDTSQKIAGVSAWSLAAAAGAFAAIYMAFVTDSEEIRAACSVLAAALIGLALAKWALNSAMIAGLEIS
ncbi:MAG: hypothetical protein WC375_07940, partial [Methanomassiliicoccales archaeon]